MAVGKLKTVIASFLVLVSIIAFSQLVFAIIDCSAYTADSECNREGTLNCGTPPSGTYCGSSGWICQYNFGGVGHHCTPPEMTGCIYGKKTWIQCGSGELSNNPNCCESVSGSAYSARCTNFQTDVNNCGSCGNKCASGESCVSGVCTKIIQCSDGADNDGDTKIDSSDPGCWSDCAGTYNPNDDNEADDFACPSGTVCDTASKTCVTPAPTCKKSGESCTYTSDCCDYGTLQACIGGTCQACVKKDQSCVSNNDCCSDAGSCIGGKCGGDCDFDGTCDAGETNLNCPADCPGVACNDRTDNDADAKIDYPADDGCKTSIDMTECFDNGDVVPGSYETGASKQCCSGSIDWLSYTCVTPNPTCGTYTNYNSCLSGQDCVWCGDQNADCSTNKCGDGSDNDKDGAIDCIDSSCWTGGVVQGSGTCAQRESWKCKDCSGLDKSTCSADPVCTWYENSLCSVAKQEETCTNIVECTWVNGACKSRGCEKDSCWDTTRSECKGTYCSGASVCGAPTDDCPQTCYGCPSGGSCGLNSCPGQTVIIDMQKGNTITSCIDQKTDLLKTYQAGWYLFKGALGEQVNISFTSTSTKIQLKVWNITNNCDTLLNKLYINPDTGKCETTGSPMKCKPTLSYFCNIKNGQTCTIDRMPPGGVLAAVSSACEGVYSPYKIEIKPNITLAKKIYC